MSLKRITNLRQNELRIGFTSGVFDLLHPGHIVMLEQARAACDYLIVGLLVDPTADRPDTKNKPVETAFERWVRLQGLESVDMVVPFSTERDLYDMLQIIKPDVRFCGAEYEGTLHTGHDIPGIEIVYNQRDHGYSSSALRDRVHIAEIKA